jgi:hypothetical protein
LNGPFSPKPHKKFPKCVSIPGIFLFVYPKKLPLQNCYAPEKAGNLRQTRKKAQESFVDCEHF